MTFMIAYVIAGISAAAFFTVWFTVSYFKLAERYHEVEAAKEQIKMHQAVYRKEQDDKKIQVARRMLETSRMIYRESIRDYNRVYVNPLYRIPGFIMGFRVLKEMEFVADRK